MAVHNKHTYSLKISKFIHSKNSLFYLFIFLIGLSIGFFCAFYLENFSSIIQTSIYSVLHALSPSPILVTSSLPPPDSSSPSPSLLTLSPPPRPSPPNEQIPLMHNMSDEDLIKNAMRIATMSVPNTTPYKVAFMFLTTGPIPLSPLWELFFKGHESLLSIYIHPHPSYNDTFPKDSIFYGRRITSQPVYWGDISMVDAERRLLANALLDASNQRFVLLSESCIPLFNFTTTYNYLINSNLSYINSLDDARKIGRGRYNPQMAPHITIQDWRKGAQWFEVNRDLALGIISDRKYYNLFKEYCHKPCYNDEHYLSTLVNILYPEMNSNRTITYVNWSTSGPHPRKFVKNDITEEFLSSVRFGSTECIYNNNMTPMCFLFARKFAPNTLMPLVIICPYVYGCQYLSFNVLFFFLVPIMRLIDV
uniref:glycosyltransferase BC10-like n=1 Tax=Erigeron canadensis TaxID=72917 RepID=UPI001CB8D869|nr:glycosyltransferase BC10-like [Erigeron canadensis]